MEIVINADGSAKIDKWEWPKHNVEVAIATGRICRCGECTCCQVLKAYREKNRLERGES